MQKDFCMALEFTTPYPVQLWKIGPAYGRAREASTNRNNMEEMKLERIMLNLRRLDLEAANSAETPEAEVSKRCLFEVGATRSQRWSVTERIVTKKLIVPSSEGRDEQCQRILVESLKSNARTLCTNCV